MTDVGDSRYDFHDVAEGAATAGCMIGGCLVQGILAVATVIGLAVLASWCFG